MDASALLSKQGWRGSGYSLDQSNRGLAKPLLVSKKVDALGLGTKKDDFSNQWWLKAWDTPTPSQVPTPPSEIALGSLSSGINSRISGTRGLYSHFVKADTLGGTIDEKLEVPTNLSATDKMSDKTKDRQDKKAKKDGKKRKRDDDDSPIVSTDSKEVKKDKKNKKQKNDKKARDLTPSAEDVEDVFFVDTTGSATKPAADPLPPKSAPVNELEREETVPEKRSRKLAEKQARHAALVAGGKKGKKAKQSEDSAADVPTEAASDALPVADPEAVKMDTGADFVSLGDAGLDTGETKKSSRSLSDRKVTRAPKLPRSTMKFQARKAKREGRLTGSIINDSTDPLSTRGKTKKKKAFMRTPEEKAAAAAGRPKVNKAEKYARQRELREQKRAWRAQIMTPERLAAEAAEKKEKKRLKKEREAQKLADKEQKKLSRNQRKAAKKAAKAQWREKRVAPPAQTA